MIKCLPLIFGLMIVSFAISFWLVLALIVHVADACGPVPFAIIAGLSLSRHVRLCEARGEREQRTPVAHLR